MVIVPKDCFWTINNLLGLRIKGANTRFHLVKPCFSKAFCWNKLRTFGSPWITERDFVYSFIHSTV